MILADTSIWVEHLRVGNQEMRKQLDHCQIVIHPFVTGELALGSLRERSKTLALLEGLPQARVAQLEEVRQMIEDRPLYGQGIGFVDAHLIASVFLTPSSQLWTRDKPLRRMAEKLGIHTNLP